jgi:propanol-preferring alcohol dehydrogenase
MGVPYHASLKTRGEGIDTIAVFGLGPVGLGHIMMQSHLGRRVIGIDRAPQRLMLASQMGAAAVINAAATEDIPCAVQALTGGHGADVCIEAAGSPATLRLCFDSVRTGGMVMFVGEQGAVPLSPSEDFIRRDITAVGSWFYHFSEYPAMLQLYRDGFDVAALATHYLPLARINDAYRLMANGESGKVMITYAE